MIKSFLVLTIILISILFSITIHHYTFPKKDSVEAILNLTELTQQSKLSLSVSSDPTYLDMPHIDRMDFIYDK